MNIRSKLAVAVALAAITPAFAQVKINDTISVTGWSVGSFTYQDSRAVSGPKPESTDSFNVDAALLGATITPTKDVSAVISLYYVPDTLGGTNGYGYESTTVLDAYVAYTPVSNVTITAGKFLSYLGYESFYKIQLNTISYANQSFLAPIPGYHEGVKVDYSPSKSLTTGIAVVDSLYGTTPAATNGAGEVKQNGGGEAYVQYTGVDGLTVWFGYGFDSKGGNGVVAQYDGSYYQEDHNVSIYDLWATYNLGKSDVLAAEEIYQQGGTHIDTDASHIGGEGSDFLVEDTHNFSDKFSVVVRASGEDVTGGGSVDGVNKDSRYLKYTLSPTYAFTANLSVRGELSYTDYNRYVTKSSNFGGVEVLFKF